jgi:hypothetical protein
MKQTVVTIKSLAIILLLSVSLVAPFALGQGVAQSGLLHTAYHEVDLAETMAGAIVPNAIAKSKLFDLIEDRRMGLFSDIRDLAQYENPYQNLAKIILNDLQKNIDQYFDLYVLNFHRTGPKRNYYIRYDLLPNYPYQIPEGTEAPEKWQLRLAGYNFLPFDVPDAFKDLVFRRADLPQKPWEPRHAYVLEKNQKLTRNNIVSGVFFESEPAVTDGSGFNYNVPALVYVVAGQSAFFQRFIISVNTQSKIVTGATLVGPEIDVKSLNLKIQTSLIDRKVIVSDAERNIKIVYPIAVGSFDEGVRSQIPQLLTPRFQDAYVSKNSLQYVRCYPNHFDCLPFIRLIHNEKPTDIGYHGPVTGKNLVRGFVSHGCMRMRERDVLELASLILNAQGKIPVSVNYLIEDRTDHPYPRTNKRYGTVYNAGTKANPKWIKDGDGLVKTVDVKAKEFPPVEILSY